MLSTTVLATDWHKKTGVLQSKKRFYLIFSCRCMKIKKRPKALFYFLQRLQQVQVVPQPTSAKVTSTNAFSNFFQALLMYFMAMPSVEKRTMPAPTKSKIQSFYVLHEKILYKKFSSWY